MFADAVHIHLSEIRESTTFDLNQECPVYYYALRNRPNSQDKIPFFSSLACRAVAVEEDRLNAGDEVSIALVVGRAAG